MKNTPVVVNIFGGPGVGKTILVADVFSALKREYISCDISHEYIKKKIREKAQKAIEDQISIFANQRFEMLSLRDEVDVILTDSPILFCSVYDKTNCPHLKALILKEHDSFNNLNYLLSRNNTVPYEQEGRYQDINGAKKVDDEMHKFLLSNHIRFKQLDGIGRYTLDIIIEDVKKALAA